MFGEETEADLLIDFRERGSGDFLDCRGEGLRADLDAGLFDDIGDCRSGEAHVHHRLHLVRVHIVSTHLRDGRYHPHLHIHDAADVRRYGDGEGDDAA